MKVRKTELSTGKTEIIEAGEHAGWPDQWLVDLAKLKGHTATEIGFALFNGNQVVAGGHSYDAAAYPDTLALAALFSQTVRLRTTPEELCNIIQQNAEDPDSTICHSHDFIDSNIAMSDAWEALTGEAIDENAKKMQTIWNTAWAVAKRYGFAEESAKGGA